MSALAVSRDPDQNRDDLAGIVVEVTSESNARHDRVGEPAPFDLVVDTGASPEA
ncbi:hypothetical protein [Streptomyces sp. enrichment culture]|uniref:hypothetical protein n=1 Tax=Streptomyces sp. enrichment culture TaxID=1795815 RepID=UPI003F5491CB